jgi:cytochrome c
MAAPQPRAPTGASTIWTRGKTEPDAVLEALVRSSDSATLASASWDQTARLWPLAGGTPRVLEGQTQNVNGVAFAPDRRTLVSVSYDQSVRIWLLADTTSPTVPTPLNAVAVAGGSGQVTSHGGSVLGR